MLLDLVYAVLIVLAVIRGWQRGLIVGIFSLLALIIGLAAAIKLSAVVAGHLGNAVKVSERWLPLLSFALVFLVVVLLVRLGANAIQRLAQSLRLGWLNRLGGILLYFVIYTTVFSVIIFYAEQMRIIQPATKEKSLTYSFIQPWGPKAINGFGKIVPVFRDMFEELETFFANTSRRIPPADR